MLDPDVNITYHKPLFDYQGQYFKPAKLYSANFARRLRNAIIYFILKFYYFLWEIEAKSVKYLFSTMKGYNFTICDVLILKLF